jgi:prophage regulatory protein
MKALRLTGVQAKVGLSKTQIYRLVQGGKFPQPAKLSERTSAWLESDIDEWLKQKFTRTTNPEM